MGYFENFDGVGKCTVFVFGTLYGRFTPVTTQEQSES